MPDALSLDEVEIEPVTLSMTGEITKLDCIRVSCCVEPITAEVTLEPVLIPGGVFSMGSPESDEPSERPPHSVQIPPFLLGRCLATPVQWLVVMGKGPARFQGLALPVDDVSGGDELVGFRVVAGLRLIKREGTTVVC